MWINIRLMQKSDFIPKIHNYPFYDEDKIGHGVLIHCMLDCHEKNSINKWVPV